VPFRIAIVQFPGSNTERETALAIQRAGMTPVEFLWNEPVEKLQACDGFILAGGFSYEDRSRAGVIASLDPVMEVIRAAGAAGKPVLGICNGAQILVEAGLIPGLAGYRPAMALARNKRTRRGHVLGTGYYNAWVNLQLATEPERTAFTRHLRLGDWIHIPLAHAEGRFLIPEALLEELKNNGQTVFRYCDGDGNILPEFPVNPNGSVYNLAAVCNPAGNVLAMMPHPERTPNGDAIFTSLREYLERRPALNGPPLTYQPEPYTIQPYQAQPGAMEWLVDLVITDNEARSVHNALVHLGLPVSITRQTHWEIVAETTDPERLQSQLAETGELFNSNKEKIIPFRPAPRTFSFLVRAREDLVGRQKLETVTHRFGLQGIREIHKGTLWNITVADDNFDRVLEQVFHTHILFNPVSHDCYRYSH
jgi:phosphoribosylformylglycinamidine synthase